MSKIIYNKLLNISLMHEYYADNVCKDFILQPTTSTLQLFRNLGILFKSVLNGTILLYEASDGIGTPKFPIDQDIKLTFIFKLQNSLFPNFTNVAFSPESSSVYYFNNLTPAISGQEHTILDAGIGSPLLFTTNTLRVTKENPTANYIKLTDINSNDFTTKFNTLLDELKIDLSSYQDGTYIVQQYDITHAPIGSPYTIYYNNDLTGGLPYAIFEVFLDDTYVPTNPVTYLFNFKSRETYWRYNILKNEANPPVAVDDFNSSTLSIQHEPDNPADEIHFATASGSDPIVIQSSDIVKFNETGFDKIRLYKNTDILQSNLPNPTHQKLDNNGSEWVSDIYAYVYV